MKRRLAILLLCMGALWSGCADRKDSADTGEPTEYSADKDAEKNGSNEESMEKQDPENGNAPEREYIADEQFSVATAVPDVIGEAEDMQKCLQNPIVSIKEDEWADYGTGDPFVMRYDGEYYLYMSTRDNETGVKCFRSRNLAEWDYCGLCSTDEITLGAYAPEVIYYNGNFYMYSSTPQGKGHHVLKSESPEGPFVNVTDNLGLSIDGSVFVDDDGSWYFYHAGDSSILVNAMSSPVEISAVTKNINARMNGWTEGPMMIKENGRYYMTYTGNHVKSRGYRIDYAVGESPVSVRASGENPVLIHTLGDIAGIGHSSSVKGPDLDSYYIVYHTLIREADAGWPVREMNIDRIVFNGDRMNVLGPTNTSQQLPDMPWIYAYFDGKEDLSAWSGAGEARADGRLRLGQDGFILSDKELAGDFTAEYNLSTEGERGFVGGFFLYLDSLNYGKFEVLPDMQKMRIIIAENGETEIFEFPLIRSFDEDVDLTVNQTFQIERKNGECTALQQDKLLGTFPCNIPEGKIGYYTQDCEGSFGFLGGSEVVGGNSACTYAKPLPGKIQGVHYENASDGVERLEGMQGTESVHGAETTNWADFRVMIDGEGSYNLNLIYAAEKAGAYSIYLDEEAISQKRELPATGGEYRTAQQLALPLKNGEHRLRIEWEGDVTLSEFVLTPYEEVEALSVSFDDTLDGILYADGHSWRLRDGVLTLDDAERPAGKQVYGSENWGNYTVSVTLNVVDHTIDAGLIFRVTNPANGFANNDSVMGTYFFQGYYAGISEKNLVLGKVNYGWEELTRIPMEFEKDREYRLEVTVQENEILVSVDGELCLEYADNNRPFLHGGAGVRGYMSTVVFDDLAVEPIAQIPYSTGAAGK